MSPGEALVASGEGGINVDGFLKKFLRESVIVRIKLVHVPLTALKRSPGVKIARWLPHGSSHLGIGDRRGDGN